MVLIKQLAWRYLKGKGTANAVPVLSRISMVAIAVGACAMMVLFSVFNGFESLIKDLYKAFYPDIKITAAKGKFFSLDENDMQKLRSVQGISYVSKVIEDNVWLNANEEDMIATLKGVDTLYAHVNNYEKYVFAGDKKVRIQPNKTAIVGLYIANKMGLQPQNIFSKLAVFYPNPKVENPVLDPASALQSVYMDVGGVFSVQDEFDSRYVLAPLSVAQSLFLQEGNYSSIEISLQSGADAEKIKQSISSALGAGYRVATRFEQNKTLYMVMKTEKWAVYAILLLVLVIASFNMVGALTLLVLEKRKDIAILKAMGVTPFTIRSLFITEGVLWALIGGAAGLLLGAALCLGQQHFQWIKLQGAFIIEAYPVVLHFSDILLVLITVIIIGLLAAWYPAVRATKVEDPTLKAS